MTDSAGRTEYRPGEEEVLAVEVNGQVVPFWPEPVDLIVGPDCSDGLELRVVLR